MKKYTGNQIRKAFLTFFQEKGHMVEQGASLIPFHDDTLLWINAGVAALKKYFDGSTKPLNNRITNAQKCLRTNDIENVGTTARHHTFFEMLGNFSIGDYFKREAIHWAYEFLTSPRYLEMDPQKLYVSIHEDDDEAYRIWTEEVGFPKERLLRTPHNFWQIGDGPCGPNTEIFFDRGEKYDPEGLGERLFFEELENDRYIEIWNIVFSQYDAREGLERRQFPELPQKNIDTGMGLERLACVMQEVDTNFDTDLFFPIIARLQELSGRSYQEQPKPFRVISDHVRTLVFALADGGNFTSEGRGYVLRRILRRSSLYLHQLGLKTPTLHQLVSVVEEMMREYYPYLGEQVATIASKILVEEEKFSKLLVSGGALLEKAIARQQVTPQLVFQMYDTYGFPVDLTREILQQHQITFDEEVFRTLMAEQQERARNARGNKAAFQNQVKALLEFTTESEFLGYQQLTVMGAEVVAIFQDGELVSEAQGRCYLIFDRTPFYATKGGQEYDKGTITFDEHQVTILDCVLAPHHQHLHLVESSQTIKVGDRADLVVDPQLRRRTMANHSGTHLLQAALKKLVGSHIQQAGTFYNEEYLKFDFLHHQKIAPQLLKEIEAEVNDYIDQAHPVAVKFMATEEAIAQGAIVIPGEKYPENARVIFIGDVSIELCGGTHVHNSHEVGVFKIISEESIGSGQRRIIAKTGREAYRALKEEEEHLASLADQLQTTPHELDGKIVRLVEENTTYRQRLQQVAATQLQTYARSLVEQQGVIGGTPVIISTFSEGAVEQFRAVHDHLKQLLPAYFLVLSDGKGKYFLASHQVAINCQEVTAFLRQSCSLKGGGKPQQVILVGEATDQAVIETKIQEYLSSQEEKR